VSSNQSDEDKNCDFAQYFPTVFRETRGDKGKPQMISFGCNDSNRMLATMQTDQDDEETYWATRGTEITANKFITSHLT